MRCSRGSVVVAVLVVAVLVPAALAGCSTHPRPVAPPRRGPTHSAPPTPTPTRPAIAVPEEACHGGIPFSPSSPPYTGTGPHRLLGFQLHDDEQQQHVIPPDSPALFPDSWAAERGTVPAVFALVPDESDYRRAQLALCMSPPRLTGKSAGTCNYSLADVGALPDEGEGSPIDVVAASYDFRLFEARTGRLVASFRINGKPGFCPGEINLGGNRKIAAGIDTDDLIAKLKPYVEGPAR